jgi:hypothetical protein
MNQEVKTFIRQTKGKFFSLLKLFAQAMMMKKVFFILLNHSIKREKMY